MFAAKKIRAGAGILAALMCAGEAGALAHTALVRHAVCVEHGEQIDALSDDAAVASKAEDVDAVSAASTSDALAGEHEHCKLSCTTPRLSSPSTKYLVVAVLDGIAPIAGTGIVIPPAVAVFRLSPKTSPPSLG